MVKLQIAPIYAESCKICVIDLSDLMVYVAPMTRENNDSILQGELDRSLMGLVYLTRGSALNAVISTNDVASSLEKENARSGTVVMASRQIDGRGRLKRKWFTEEGDIAMSIILRPPFVPKNWPLISMIPAVAVVDALAKLGVIARLKWPNDVIIQKRSQDELVPYFDDFRKLGGILVENVFCEDTLAASIIGIGLNIMPKQTVKDTVPHAAFIGDYQPNLRREDCMRAILCSLDHLLARIAKPDFMPNLIEAYGANCETLGRKVVAIMPDRKLCGRAIALDRQGSLIIHDGIYEYVIYAGDVIFVR